MTKTVLPAAVLVVTLAALLALATPAFPQTSSMDLAADEKGNLVAPRPPEYRVTEDGTLIIGGDVEVNCAEVGIVDAYSPGADDPTVRAQIDRSLGESARACQDAGFPTAADVSSVALPETAGASPLLLTGLLLLAGGGLLAIRGTR